MAKKENILPLIIEQGLLPLYYDDDADVSIEVLKTLYSAGIRVVEYTNRGRQALRNFKKMRKVCDEELRDMHLAAGTIKNKKAARQFIDAGADFIISPGMVKEVADVADKSNLLWIPGCMSATEIIHAENSGAKLVKIFPGNILGPSFVSSIRDIFPDLLFMPTGGVEIDSENIAAWFKAGVCAVGMGSKLLSKELLQNKDYAAIRGLVLKAIFIVNSAR